MAAGHSAGNTAMWTGKIIQTACRFQSLILDACATEMKQPTTFSHRVESREMTSTRQNRSLLKTKTEISGYDGNRATHLARK